jgi:hypothetical protein
MTRKTKFIIGGCGISVVLTGVLGLLFLWFVLPGILLTPRSYTEAQMWRITHEWTRTAALPPEATDVSISTHGSDFTRQFKARFRLPPASQQNWMAASPGFTDATLTVESDGSKVYLIKPGGGAMLAEITIHPDGVIDINTYWS